MDVNETLNKLTPDWTYRRAFIKWLLRFLCGMLVVCMLGTLGLAYFAKFSITVSTFFIVFVICDFMALLGIIGSYIFQASWDNKDFLNILPSIIPHMNKDEVDKEDHR